MIIKDSYDALIVANGAPPSEKLFIELASRSKNLIAVDGGLKVFRRAGITPSLLIGDLDSVSPDDISWIRRRKTKTLPRRSQNATDLEKTLLYCRLRKWKSVAVFSINGDRPDHYLNGLDLAFKFRGLSLHYFVDGMLLIPMSGKKSLTLDTDDV
ncbi:thiamine diphosphokinase, partial [bacterium]|nr:thiamine diphosphokinase [bacterium]